MSCKTPSVGVGMLSGRVQDAGRMIEPPHLIRGSTLGAPANPDCLKRCSSSGSAGIRGRTSSTPASPGEWVKQKDRPV